MFASPGADGLVSDIGVPREAGLKFIRRVRAQAGANVGKYQRSPLTGNIDANVRVVGAGIAGMTTAYLLARARKSVVALDDGGRWADFQ